jgi:triphosphoribosyl-dephospho-CoA synthase
MGTEHGLRPEEVATLAQLACLLEATASKPGNVSPTRSFRDMRYEDFLVSALAIGPALAQAGRLPLGVTIRWAHETTRRWTPANTNLGILLLLAPLAKAAFRTGGDLRSRVHHVLGDTTVEDATEVYAAIREARPGGMGKVDAQDLGSKPTVTLREAMRLSAERDAVAREYVTDFAVTFELTVPALEAALGAGLGWLEAAAETFLTLLAQRPDTLIARKLGPEAAARVTEQAHAAWTAGGVRTPEGREALLEFDASLRDAQNSRNPGTTADLTAAALFVVLLDRGGL